MIHGLNAFALFAVAAMRGADRVVTSSGAQHAAAPDRTSVA